jgi:predicted dehydrogenase
MNKDIKILIIGFGSIGQRHYKNICNLGYKQVFVYDTDVSKLNSDICKIVKRLDFENLEELKVVFICNPSNDHVKTALLCAKAGCHIFIEKPISHNQKNIKELISICKETELIHMVGCNMRLHPGMQFIKKYLREKKLGKLYSIYFETGYYFPYWRPNQDYRKNYGAKWETGGGILLDGGIHNFDLLFWLNDFNDVIDYKIYYDKISDLEIETKDIFSASIKFKNKVLGSIRGDYLQKHYSWNCKIVREKGNLEWNCEDNTVWLKNEKRSKKLFSVKNYDSNDMYVEEIKYFLNCVKNREKTFNDIETAANTLKYCLKK